MSFYESFHIPTIPDLHINDRIARSRSRRGTSKASRNNDHPLFRTAGMSAPRPRAPREENRQKVGGKRLRQQEQTAFPDSQASSSDYCSNQSTTTRSTRFGSALHRVSTLKLFHHRQTSARPSRDNETAPKSLVEAENDTVPLLDSAENSKEEPRRQPSDGSPPEPAGSHTTNRDTSSSLKPPVSIRNIWKKSLQTFRRRHPERPLTDVDDSRTGGHHMSDPVQPLRSGGPGNDAFQPGTLNAGAQQSTQQPQRTKLASSKLTVLTVDVESPLDLASITDGSMTTLDEIRPESQLQQPRKQKPKKPKHGDDSLLIGMTITFDPTMELLEMGNQPQCINKSKLTGLQKIYDYSGTLLGDTKEEEESTQASPSNADLLGFHLECFDQPTEPESPEKGQVERMLAAVAESDEEVEIIFQDFAVDFDSMNGSLTDPTSTQTDTKDIFTEDDIEIVFSHIDDVRAPDADDNVSAHGWNDDNDMSRSSEGSGIPLEWLLPPDSKIYSPQYEEGLLADTETPEYEWFLPEHLGIPFVNRHSPLALFGELSLENVKATSCTPSTAAETETSFEFQASFDSSHGSNDEVLSLGSLPSDAVRSLLDFCQMSETKSHMSASITCRDVYGNYFSSRNVTESIHIISRGIDL